MERVRISAAFVGLAVVTVPSGHAGAFDAWQPDGNACNQRQSTTEIVSCMEARTKVWDGRLNQAYKTLTAGLRANSDSKQQLDQLMAAQRLWLQYREANCSYYSLEQGTIRQVYTADCVRRMTQDRAIELQQAGHG